MLMVDLLRDLNYLFLSQYIVKLRIYNLDENNFAWRQKLCRQLIAAQVKGQTFLSQFVCTK